MSDLIDQSVFEFALPEQGVDARFKTAAEFSKWNQDELAKWQWIVIAQPLSGNIGQAIQNNNNQFNQLINEWNQQLRNPQALENIFGRLRNLLQQRYQGGGFLNLTKAEVEFLFQLKSKSGDMVAAGAYTLLIKVNNQPGGSLPGCITEIK